ncbi:ParB N-terminal domain-containing protein [Lysobacter auxotrophicus]|uniref:ParB N-terminal domain-containing protein n=1 Tax=Lysobacter auxotrophicus TaxID=2992573 RepID=A0ABM8DA33_9GAMM|nr:ParB N-terminal domain-containing protein [Lysobacter auxotrophicus]BDU15378.1 ParB N-terminal domain-containing protein [Lysobacter auxotrophicus]
MRQFSFALAWRQAEDVAEGGVGVTREFFATARQVPVENLLLDTHNARIRSGADQADCIARILRKPDQLIALAGDIAENGLSTTPILVEPTDKRRFIVWDGNRRVTALKLLNDPSLCPAASLRRRFEAIHQKHSQAIPARVDCLSSTSHDALVAEVVKRHSGALGGVGQLDWSAFLRTLFMTSHEQSEPNQRAAHLFLWGEEHGVEVDDDFPITTITRFLSKDNLTAIGFGYKDGHLVPLHGVETGIAVVSKINTDFSKKTGTYSVDRVFNEKLQADYISEVRAVVGMPPPPRAGAPYSSSSGSAMPSPSRGNRTASGSAPKAGGTGDTPSTSPGGPPGDPKPSPRPGTPRKPTWDRSKLFRGRSLGFSIPSSNVKAYNIVVELGKLSPKDTPLAVAALFRMLVELSTAEYYRRHPDVPARDGTHKKIAAVARHLHSAGKISEGLRDQVLQRTTEAQGMLQYNTLNNYMHDVNAHPEFRSLNTLWDEIEPYLAACWSA